MANRRFEMYEYRQALLRMRQGDTNRSIGRAGLMGRKKAAQVREIARDLGWLDPQEPLPADAELETMFGRREPTAPASVSPLEPYRDEVETWCEKGLQITTIYSLLRRKRSYTGSYSSVRRFVRRIAPQRPRTTMLLHFQPGESVQVDFGSGPLVPDPVSGELRRTWIFVMTLCWSRHQYAELVWDQKVPTWLACHQRAFRFFGGVPAKARIDNASCAIVQACRREPQVQRAYYELAEAYGFQLDVCPPGSPQMKGRVESGVKYVKRSFLPERTFRSLEDGNAQLAAWVLEEAGQRRHGTTRERPLERFAEVEKLLLQPLPSPAYEPAEWKRLKLHRDGHVRFEHCRYSAPWTLVGRVLEVRVTATMVQIYEQHELVATHSRCRSPGQHRTVEDHLSPEARAYGRQTPQWCREQAEQVGPKCHAVVESVLADRVVDRLPAAKGILALRKSYGDARLESACRRALTFDDPRYRTVKTILSRGLDQVPLVEEASDGLRDTYTGRGRFTRDAATMLSHRGGSGS